MNIDPNPIRSWIELILVIVGAVTVISAIIVKVNKRFENRVSSLIKAQSLPIQPTTNGGYSLTDLHAKVDELRVNQKETFEREERRRETWHDRYLEDQKRVKKEWVALLIALRRLFPLPLEDRQAEYDRITSSYINGTISDDYPDERKTDA